MPAKAPIYLKTAGGKNASGHKGSKKLREILSTDMISPPLGDFRHMAHVGRGGNDDMFGDTSFLQKGNNTIPPLRKSDSNLPNGSSAFRRGGSLGKKEKGSKKERNTSSSHPQTSTLDRFKRKKHGSKSDATNGGKSDAVLQSALSLPILSNDEPDKCSASPQPDESSIKTANESPSSSNNNTIDKQKIRSKSQEEVYDPVPPQPKQELPQKTPNGVPSGPPKPRRILSTKGESPSKKPEIRAENIEPSNLTRFDRLSSLRRSSEVLSEMPESVRKLNSDGEQEDDGWALDLDLGPSLMDEIMGIMDKSKIVP